MARVDDYIHAIKISAESLSLQPSDLLSSQAGFEMTEPAALRIPFLDRVYRLEYPGFAFSDESQPGKQIPLQEQVLILHYLQGKHKPGISSKWIAYREIPGASFYFSAFVKRAIDPLKKTFGANKLSAQKAATLRDARVGQHEDPLRRHEPFQPVARHLEHRPRSGQVQELLWTLFAAHGPESGSGTSGHDRDDEIRCDVHLSNSSKRQFQGLRITPM